MALTTKFGFTNTGASTNKVDLFDLDILGDYALIEDEPTKCSETNVTTPVDQPEVISFGCTEIANVASSIKNLYPPHVKGGVQYQIKVEELLSTTSSEDATFRVDDPIVAYLTVRHPKSANVTAAHVLTVIERLMSALYKEDGTTRLDDLMRSALKPTSN